MEYEIDELACALVSELKEKGKHIATTESCTGGLLAASIVNISGASYVFNEGYITYSNEAKARNLGIDLEQINCHGAVSEYTATHMAEGCRKKAGADIALSTTGIAGPDGGTPEKPVGTVYIGVSTKTESFSVRFNFSGDREAVRKQTVETALKLALENIE